MASNEALPWIVFYALVISVLLPVIKLYRDTPFGIVPAAGLWFVLLVPMILAVVIRRSSAAWPLRILNWHLIACTCILGLSMVTLVVHWLGGLR
jgi:hypothetical protein